MKSCRAPRSSDQCEIGEGSSHGQLKQPLGRTEVAGLSQAKVCESADAVFDLDAHPVDVVEAVRFLKTLGLIHKAFVLMDGHSAEARLLADALDAERAGCAVLPREAEHPVRNHPAVEFLLCPASLFVGGLASGAPDFASLEIDLEVVLGEEAGLGRPSCRSHERVERGGFLCFEPGFERAIRTVADDDINYRTGCLRTPFDESLGILAVVGISRQQVDGGNQLALGLSGEHRFVAVETLAGALSAVPHLGIVY